MFEEILAIFLLHYEPKRFEIGNSFYWRRSVTGRLTFSHYSSNSHKCIKSSIQCSWVITYRFEHSEHSTTYIRINPTTLSITIYFITLFLIL